MHGKLRVNLFHNFATWPLKKKTIIEILYNHYPIAAERQYQEDYLKNHSKI